MAKASPKKPDKKGDRLIAQNRRAAYEFELGKSFEAGLVLIGSEARALREGPGDISEAWVEVQRGEAFVRGMRVGALPQFPSNALNYNLTWSTDGVINEYCEPCDVIADGVLRTVPALEEREEFSLDGVTYEAFNTSGGIGTLCETLRN